MTDRPEDETPASLARRISAGDRESTVTPSDEDQPPNAALGPVGLLLYPYRRVLLPFFLISILILVIVALAT